MTDTDSPLGEERRRKVRKKRRVTTVTVAGKEIKGDLLKNPDQLAFPDPARRWRKWIIAGLLIAAVLLSVVLFLYVSDKGTHFHIFQGDK